MFNNSEGVECENAGRLIQMFLVKFNAMLLQQFDQFFAKDLGFIMFFLIFHIMGT